MFSSIMNYSQQTRGKKGAAAMAQIHPICRNFLFLAVRTIYSTPSKQSTGVSKQPSPPAPVLIAFFGLENFFHTKRVNYATVVIK